MDPEAHRFLEHWRLQSGFLGHGEGAWSRNAKGTAPFSVPEGHAYSIAWCRKGLKDSGLVRKLMRSALSPEGPWWGSTSREGVWDGA